jgi:hypothetical protein
VWQTATESAQVQAGLVVYPADNSFGMYHHKLWTLVVQCAALGLAAGAREDGVNLAMTGAMGALSFVGISLVTWVFSRHTLVSLAAPFFVWAARLYALGTTYTIWIFGSPHTFGITGTAYGIFCLALLGLGYTRGLALALGLSPAVHPSIGAWLWGVTLLTLLFEPRRALARVREHGVFFLMGLGVTLVSFAHHLVLSRGLPTLPTSEKRRYIESFITWWDDHRHPVPIASAGVLSGFMTACLGGVWLRLAPNTLDPNARMALRAATVAATMALVSSVLSHTQPWLPLWVKAAMPWRNMNISALAFPAIALGLAAKEESRDARLRPLMPLLVVASLALLTVIVPGWVPPLAELDFGLTQVSREHISVLTPAGCAALLIFVRLREAWVARSPATDATARFQWARELLPLSSGAVLLLVCAWALSPGQHPFLWPLAVSWGALFAAAALLAALPGSLRGRLSGLVVYVILALAVWKTALDAQLGWTRLPVRYRDPESAVMLDRASRLPGLLLIASNLSYFQLRTRRPVLLFGHALNTLPYVPESGPAMEGVLREVYGIELTNPGRPRHHGLATEDGRSLWESRSSAEWRALARRYHLGGIITYQNWNLNLPRVAQTRWHALYVFDP